MRGEYIGYTPPLFFNDTVQTKMEIEKPVPPTTEIKTEMPGIQKPELINDFGMILFEKYRPTDFNAIMGQNEIVQSVKKNLRNLPHMILEGPPGTGKTTLAYVIAKELNAEIMSLNGSDDRGIDVIRGKVLNFIRHASLHNKLKIVFFDEADGLTNDAQECLRSIMERYPRTVRYVFACNDIEAFIEPLRSRCKDYHFSKVNNQDIANRLSFISNAEGLNLTREDIEKITIDSKGDMRKAINMLQGGC